jgi:hypothetical protein
MCKPIDIIRGLCAPFLVEEVEAVAQKREEVLAGLKDTAAEFRIIGLERIQYDEMWSVADPYPIL